jgi:hypothetical protein
LRICPRLLRTGGFIEIADHGYLRQELGPRRAHCIRGRFRGIIRDHHVRVLRTRKRECLVASRGKIDLLGRRGETLWRMPDRPRIVGAAHLQIAFGLHERRQGERKAGFRLGHICPCHVADMEPIVRRLELPLQYSLVVNVELDRSLIAHDVEVGLCDAKKDLLLCRQSLGTLQDHRVLSLLDEGGNPPAGPERLRQIEVEGPGREILCAGDRGGDRGGDAGPRRGGNLSAG